MITTTLGDKDEALLHKTEGGVDNELECTKWVEYREREGGEIIHRSVHVHLKKPWVEGAGLAASLPGGN